jgi:predicted ATPase with chaperone activity
MVAGPAANPGEGTFYAFGTFTSPGGVAINQSPATLPKAGSHYALAIVAARFLDRERKP